ncbi:TPA_asm: hypothetical protein, partial [ssRNA phage SRR6253161_4]
MRVLLSLIGFNSASLIAGWLAVFLSLLGNGGLQLVSA